ncbi:MAG: 30S ribosome-binding factor RbfA [Planctomycetota bacterium]|nr:30S ribosome-binding factor RbfA [Planctomycetota bacterium]
MKYSRVERLNQLYRQEVSKMILTELRDPRIGFVTVVSASVDRYLERALVRVSVLGGDKDVKLTLRGLNSAASRMQGEIARRLKLRSTPILTFEFDPGVQKSIRVEQLLRKDSEGVEPDTQLPYASDVLPTRVEEVRDDKGDDKDEPEQDEQKPQGDTSD